MSEQPESHDAQPTAGYFAKTRSTVVSLILVAPLFILYQLGVLTTDGWQNGVDFITPRLYALSGQSTLVYLLMNLVVLAMMLIATRVMGDRQRPDKMTWALMLGESFVYATFLGQVISRMLLWMGLEPPGLSTSPLHNLVMSVGAGVYEELVFRLLLLSALIGLGRAIQLKALWAIGGAVVVSSVAFSAFHYEPIGLESWQLWSFSFRFMAGLLFATLYLTRGFAVAAYTHAMYDIHVLVL